MDRLFDRDLAIRRRLRAIAMAKPGAAFLAENAAEDLGLRLATVDRRFDDAATLFCVVDRADEILHESGKVSRIVRVEADPAFAGADAIISPTEMLNLPAESLDLAVSLYALHDLDDVPGMLFQIRRVLRPDGLFLGCMAGTGTLGELREALLAAETELTGGASPRVFPFADIRDAGALLQRAGFALPVTDVENVTVRYDDMFALMHDLRAMGATNTLLARSRRPTPRGMMMRAAQIYAERFSDPDGRIRATFSTIWLSGWAPHASQQKPLAPGSATVSLASVLERKQ